VQETVRISDSTVSQAVRVIKDGEFVRLQSDQGFFDRVYGTPHSVYRERLEFAGLTQHDRVLDAGCGFGQWSLALAETNRWVHALDIDLRRVGVLRRLGLLLKFRSLCTSAGSLANLPFAEDSFDAVFCYSVVYMGDWREGTSELVRVTRPGGTIYVSANALGWHVYNLLNGHNAAAGPFGSPRQMAWATIRQTIGSRLGKKYGADQQSFISPRSLCAQLERCGARVDQVAADGRAGIPELAKPIQFFKSKKYGLDSVYEILATKL
jgi:SAM-dependent methyltransferase